jgi:hypothetical protein
MYPNWLIPLIVIGILRCASQVIFAWKTVSLNKHQLRRGQINRPATKQFFLFSSFSIFFVLKCRTTLTVAYHVQFFLTKSNFHIVLICTVHTVYKYKITQYPHNFYSIYISTGVFFVCEGYTEWTPIEAGFALTWQNLEDYVSILSHA